MIDRTVIWQPEELRALKPLAAISGRAEVRPVDSIVIHHTCGGSSETAQSIHAEHLRVGYGGCGYHYLIDRDGRTWRGRPLWARGAHCRSNNAGRIGIAFMGRYDTEPPSRGQIGVCLGLIAQLQALFGPLGIWPHYAVPGSSTVCPGAACVLALAEVGVSWHVQ